MDYNEVNQTTANALKRRNQRSIFSNNWEFSGKLLSSLAVPKSAVQGGEESFIENSRMFGALMDQVQVDELSITDLIILSQASKAIEEGDSKAATFVRDTAGGKPTEKVQKAESNMTELTDEQLEFLLTHSEVEEDEYDTSAV